MGSLNFGFSTFVLSRVFFCGITLFGLGLVIKSLAGHVIDTLFSTVCGEIAFDGVRGRTVS